MAFSFILSTGRGFFRRKDLLFPDILSAVLCVFLLALGSSGTLYFLLPLGFGLLVGAFAYFFLTERKSYGFYWINHALYFALLIPRDQRFALHAIFAVLIGFGLWWIGERKLRIRFPLALVQLLIFLLLYLIPGIQIWSVSPGFGFQDPNFTDLYTRGVFQVDANPSERFSALQASGGYSVLLLLPIFLKRPIAVLLPIAFGVFLAIWTFQFGIPVRDFISEPIWAASSAFAIALAMPGHNTESVLPVSFLSLVPIAIGIFFISAGTIPSFTWVASFFFIESLLIRIFLGDRIEKHEPAPGFT
ncbi:hypothetical protein [Leptospira fainei]|uniref:hypothetical protein n=1 Tax=Leptospira fainei TaxID=48782 RepID=UPI0005879921|nr:hypothetical protein [Leptospira fainei]